MIDGNRKAPGGLVRKELASDEKNASGSATATRNAPTRTEVDLAQCATSRQQRLCARRMIGEWATSMDR